MTDEISPNSSQAAATESSAVPSLDSIAAKMTAMREHTLRNQINATNQTATGQEDSAETSSPVDPEGTEVADTSDDNVDNANQESEVQEADAEPVNGAGNDNTTAEDLIDFFLKK